MNRVIEAFYDAAADPDGWSGALRLAAEFWDTPFWVAQVHSPRRDGTELIATSWPPEALDLYVRHYWKVDPWTAGSKRLPPLRANLGEELADPRAVVRSEIYHDFAKPYLGGIVHLIGGLAPLENGAMGMMGLHRPREAEPYSRQDQRLFGLLLPHYQRALRIRQTLRAATVARAIGFAALDGLSAGAIVAAANGRVLFANRAAEALAAERDGLDLGYSGRPIGAARPPETATLRALIAAAADPARATRGGALRLPRPSGRPAYVVLVAPLPTLLSESGRGGGYALLIVTDPTHRPRAPAATLAALYGLTPREAQLAEILLSGCGPDQAAEHLAITRETVRTYLKRIFAKTGTTRQAELIALLMRATTLAEDPALGAKSAGR